MSASIDVTGLARFSKSIRRAVSGDLQQQMVTNLHQAGPKIAADMRGAASTKIQRKAVGSVDVFRTSAGIDIAGGRGTDLPAVLFDGAEYGGRKTKKVTYTTRSPRGTAYIVRRRTTMQFRPHLGRRGWFFWPTVREWMDTLAEEQDALVQKTLGGA